MLLSQWCLQPTTTLFQGRGLLTLEWTGLSVVPVTVQSVMQDSQAETQTGRSQTLLAHAAVDGPDGIHAVVLPANRAEALQVKRRHDERFWCSTQAGGCGGNLLVAAGSIRVPYFRHRPGAGCALAADSARAARSYAHLDYQRALMAWLAGLGLQATIEHHLGEDGRADLHVVVHERRHTIEVQLSPIADSKWRERDERYRRQVDHVTWLYGPGAETAAATERAHRGHALLLRSTTAAVESIGAQVAAERPREVEVGLATDLAESWCALKDCQLRFDGFWTPALDQSLAAVAAARGAAAERSAEQAQRAAERLAATVAERAARMPLPVPAPAPQGAWGSEYGTLAWWRHVFPDHALWAPARGWGWADHLDADDRAAAHILCYVVQRLHASGSLRTLLPPDGSAGTQVIDVLEEAGFIRRYNHHGVERWVRIQENEIR